MKFNKEYIHNKGFKELIKSMSCYYSQQGNERAREKHDVRISLLILHRVVSFLQL